MNSASREVVDLQINAADNLIHLLHLSKIVLLSTLIKNKTRNIWKHLQHVSNVSLLLVSAALLQSPSVTPNSKYSSERGACAWGKHTQNQFSYSVFTYSAELSQSTNYHLQKQDCFPLDPTCINISVNRYINLKNKDVVVNWKEEKKQIWDGLICKQ